MKMIVYSLFLKAVTVASLAENVTIISVD